MDTPTDKPTLQELRAFLDEKDRLLEEFTRTHGIDPEARAAYERGKEELLGRVRQHLEAPSTARPASIWDGWGYCERHDQRLRHGDTCPACEIEVRRRGLS